ncbi:MAG: signal peptidase I [Dehalococcoidia bacterium]
MKILREAVITVLIALAVFAGLRLTMQSYVVVMSSMEPNFQQGERLMVNKLSYRSSGPQRGEVIIFYPPFQSPHPYIKRVIGLPGDIVEIREGKVSINGTVLEEEYIMAPSNEPMPPTEVPQNQYFVLGDNRNSSNDSHTGWTVPRDNIIGKAWFVYWPPSKWGLVKHYTYPELPGGEEQAMGLYQAVGGAT